MEPVRDQRMEALKIRKNNRGVTLVELVMAIVVLALISIPMGLMIRSQIQGMMAGTDLTIAGNLARLEIERLQNLPFADILSGTTSYPGYAYDISRTVVTTAGGGGAILKDITVTVSPSGSPSPAIEMYSSIVNNVTYAS